MSRSRPGVRTAAPVWAVARPRPASDRGGSGGQILILFTVALVLILLFAGLVIDGGVAFVNRRDAQNTADLASMAGTKVVLDHYVAGGRTGAQVYAALDASASANGCRPTGPPPCAWTGQYVDRNLAALGPVSNGGPIPSGAQGVLVEVQRRPRTYFLGLIGQDAWAVGTDGTSLTASVPALPVGQVLPIAADPPATYAIGDTYVFTAGKDGPGNFGWLSWTGSNDPNALATSTCTPNNPEITFPQWIDGDPGKSNSTGVRSCVQKWIDNGATVLIPIWDQARGHGNGWEYRITGLAAFVITAKAQPAIDAITGRFVGYYNLPSIGAGYGGPPCDPTLANCPNKSTFIGLVR